MNNNHKLSILHIDEDFLFQDLFSAIFQDSLKIDSVKEVDEAIDKLSGKDYDAVISEYNLSGVNGLLFLEKVKLVKPNVPVIFYTTEGSQNVIRKAFLKGASDYIIKSYEYISDGSFFLNALEEAIKRQKADEAFTENSDRFRDIVEKAEAGYFYLDTNGIYVKVNDSFLKIFGLDSSFEIVGKHFSEKIIQLHDNQINDILRRLREGRAVKTIDLACRVKDDDIRYLTVSIRPVKYKDKVTGMEGFIIDATEKRLIENRLEKQEDSTRLIMKSSTDTISIHDAKGKFIFFEAPQNFNIDAKKIPGKYPYEVFDKSQSKIVIEQINEVVKSGKHSYCYRYETLENDNRVFIDECFPIISSKDGTLKVGRISKDISSFREINRELIDKNRELEEYTYKVSHDIRNPVSNIILYLELIKEQPSLFDMYYPKVITIAKDVINLLNELLTLAKVGKVIREKEQLDLKPYISNIFAKYAHESASSELIMEENLSPVYGDPITISQVFNNLIQNSFQNASSEADGLRIEIQTALENEYVIITYRDNGLGIDKEKIDRVFDLGFTTNERKEGSGFGLAMIKKIIEAHDGKISVKSKGRNKGSEFQIKLPLQEVSALQIGPSLRN